MHPSLNQCLALFFSVCVIAEPRAQPDARCNVFAQQTLAPQLVGGQFASTSPAERIDRIKETPYVRPSSPPTIPIHLPADAPPEPVLATSVAAFRKAYPKMEAAEQA